MERQDKTWLKRPTMDEFLSGKSHMRDVSFTGVWKCNLCSCHQYEGGSSPSDLCKKCGHERQKHEYR